MPLATHTFSEADIAGMLQKIPPSPDYGTWMKILSAVFSVLPLAPGARLLASAPTCPVAGFTYGDHVVALQPHPELDTITVGNLAERFRPVIGDVAADAARAGLAAGHDGDAIGRLIVEFLSA